jgi:L-threonylcarbamoyladenylate synthase
MSISCTDPGEIARRLLSGELAILPTDTLPGLHCLATAEDAVARIRDIKGRDADKPLLVLCADSETALQLVEHADARVQDYLDRCWPGPFTLIFKASSGTPQAAVSTEGSVAIRVPDDHWLMALLHSLDAPLISTSVNRAGEAPAVDMVSAVQHFGDAVDFHLDPSVTQQPDNPVSSCLLDMRGGPPIVLRQGPMAPPDWDQR